MTGQEIFTNFIRLSDAWQASDPATRGDAPSLVKMIDEAIEEAKVQGIRIFTEALDRMIKNTRHGRDARR